MLRACRYTFALAGVVYGGKYLSGLFFFDFAELPFNYLFSACLITVVQAKYIIIFFISKYSFVPFARGLQCDG
jgi:hypothetical protein